jgi:hypothetical protein
MMAAITARGVPPSSILVIAVCRRSWNRHGTAAAVLAVAQAFFQLPIAFFAVDVMRVWYSVVTGNPVPLGREYMLR